MAKKPKRGSYLNLDDVRVFYDSKTDTISLTSGDEDLPEAGGLKIDLSPGTQNERQLRELLKLKGVIRWDPWPRISREDTLRMIQKSTEGQLHLGTDIQGDSVTWDSSRGQSLWTHGIPGQGSTFIAHLLAAHAANHGWKSYGIDSRLDLYRIRAYAADATIVHEPQDFLPLLAKLSTEFEGRRALSPEERSELPGTLFMIDSLDLVLEAIDQEELKLDFINELTALARMARSSKLAVQINSNFPEREQGDVRQKLYGLWHQSEHLFVGNYPVDKIPHEFRDDYSGGRGRGSGMAQYREANFQIGALEENPVDALKRRIAQRAAS